MVVPNVHVQKEKTPVTPVNDYRNKKVQKKELSRLVVSIYRPLGYGPNTLPLRQTANPRLYIGLLILDTLVFLKTNIQAARTLFESAIIN